MFAAVDLGSNSFRLHVGYHDGNTIRVVKSARDPVRLGAGLAETGNLTDEAMAVALQCLQAFRAILAEYSLDDVRVVATSTLRVAKNASAFLPAAEAAIGYPIEVISGEEEGRLIYMGVSCALGSEPEKRIVIDIGGGSTEVVLGNGPDIRHVESFSIGTVKHGAEFFPDGRIDEDAFNTAILSARSYFEDAAAFYAPSLWTRAYGTSGTIRTICEVISKNSIGDGGMSLDSLHALRTLLVEAGHISHVSLTGARPERVPAMVGGLAILIGAMEELGATSIDAVNAGLRVGVLWDLQLRASRRDRREKSILEFARRFHADHERGARVAGTAAELYKRLKPATNEYARYVYWSGVAHEVGLAVSPTGYHKHSAYLVANADLPGFMSREQRLLSMLILAQKGNLRKIGDAVRDASFARAVLALRLSLMLMHSKTEFPADELKLRMKGGSKIEIEARKDWIRQHPTLLYLMQKESGSWDEIGVEFQLKVI